MEKETDMQTNIPLSDLPGWALPAIIVLAAVQLGLAIYALVVMLRTPEDRLVFEKRWPWVVIILFVNLIGAIVFLAAGRKPAKAADPLTTASSAQPAPPRKRADRAMDVLYGDPETGGASEGHAGAEGDAR
jgi:hypothetical protein